MTTRRVIAVGDVSRARTKPPVPPSAAWEIGDPVAGRRFAEIGDLTLEAAASYHVPQVSTGGAAGTDLVAGTGGAVGLGATAGTGGAAGAIATGGIAARLSNGGTQRGILPHVIVAYETFGTLHDDGDNAILLLHALTGDAHVRGPKAPGQLTSGWWEEMVGPGKPIDTDKYFVVVPNVLGGCSGTTGPASRRHGGKRWGGNFPRITVRDQVKAEIRLAQHLGITHWHAIIGASMGGLRALEWAVMGPENGITVDGLVVIATSAATSADQIAWAHPQLAAIRLDPGYHGGDYYDNYDDGGPHRGLAIARQIAHTTYRSAAELDERFRRFPQSGEDPLVDGRYAIQSYSDHHGDKLARRFDANTYIILTEAMLTHDLGRDRGGVEEALSSITARTLAVSVDSDRLYPVSQLERIANGIPDAGLAIIHSAHGHDGFLIENQQLDPIVRDILTQLKSTPTQAKSPEITLVA